MIIKANETPEKIYLFKNPITETPDNRWLFKRSDDADIEYIRTDAFIERTCEWLKYNLVRFVFPNNMGTIYVSPSLFDKFKQEWREQQ